MDHELWLHGQVIVVSQFYNDPGCTYEAFLAYARACERALRQIYCARNRVVHDAAASSPLLEQLAAYASAFANNLLQVACAAKRSGESLLERLTRVEAEVQLLQNRLKRREQVDLLALPGMAAG